MQEWQIQYSEMSRRDLQTIKKYITYNLKSPNTAVKQINQIIKAIDNLSFFLNVHLFINLNHEEVSVYAFFKLATMQSFIIRT